jgi:hypothetical protein
LLVIPLDSAAIAVLRALAAALILVSIAITVRLRRAGANPRGESAA